MMKRKEAMVIGGSPATATSPATQVPPKQIAESVRMK